MKYIIKLHPEIMMKSNSVRKRFVKILAGNLRNTLKPLDETVVVVQHWDYIVIVIHRHAYTYLTKCNAPQGFIMS